MEASNWIIKKWEHGLLPWDLFREGGDLLILGEGDACTLVWTDANNRLCWIQDLPFWTIVPNKSVNSGEKTFRYEVAVSRNFTPETPDTPAKTTLCGTLKLEGMGSGDGNAGIFIAEGSGPPPPDPSEE